jgi:hypothetical protein
VGAYLLIFHCHGTGWYQLNSMRPSRSSETSIQELIELCLNTSPRT